MDKEAEHASLVTKSFGEDQPQLVGEVSHVVFAAPDSFYKVLAVKIQDKTFEFDDDEMTVTGNFGDIHPGDSYIFTGKLTHHPRFGDQFAADNYQHQAIESAAGVIKYLSSDQFKGIGEVTAKKVVTALGKDAIEKILADPTVLKQTDLSPALQTTLVKQLAQSDGVERTIITLNNYGFGTTLANKIYEKYQTATLEQLTTNPYQLVLDIDGISFKRIDQLAAERGFPAADEHRIQAAVMATLSRVTFESGDTYSDYDSLLDQTRALLEQAQNTPIELALIQKALLQLTEEGKIVAEGDHLYLKALFDAEETTAKKLLALSRLKGHSFQRKAVVKELAVVKEQNAFTYDSMQEDAIIAALTNNLFILTGGPGTGKTTIINAIVTTYRRLARQDGVKDRDIEKGILLAAPTGRAAKRLSEATELPASTIHRLLGITGRESLDTVEIEPLVGGLVIIDEMSMVDTQLFALLLSAIPAGMHVILVGDKDQLPSVGPGQVFFDLLASGLLNYRELETIHRQGKGSSIISLASDVKQGRLPADFTQQQPDRSYFNAQTTQVPKLVAQIIKSWQARGNSVADMQILSPMYRSPAGVHQLNQIAQEIFNPAKAKRRELEVKVGDFAYTLRIGDKVMQTSNDPENNIFNGDIGYVSTILLAKDKDNETHRDMVTVDFATGPVDYGRQDLPQLRLAYATTIHKAQGAEYKLVIMPMVAAFSRMLQRNLLYTGLTRASESLVLIGDVQAFNQAVQTQGIGRKTTLKERLRQEIAGSLPSQAPDRVADEGAVTVKPVGAHSVKDNATKSGPTVSHQYQLTAALIAAETIDPNIGMAGLKPTDFMPANQG